MPAKLRSNMLQNQPDAADLALPVLPVDAEISIAVVGCDFRVCSTALRNQLLMTAEERAQLAAELQQACAVDGLVVLETCNRVEWIVASATPQWAAEVLRAQMVARLLRADPSGLNGRSGSQPYAHIRSRAVLHLLRVAVGLESFVLGEREIAGQLNRAVTAARAQGQASAHLNALQTTVGRTVKKVQRLTNFRHHSRGVHGLALDALRDHFVPTAQTKPRVAVIGMGEIGRKTAGLLAQSGFEVHRVNRTVPADRTRDWLALDDALPALLQNVDAMVVATGSRRTTVHLHAGDLPSDRKLVVVDLGAPAQVSRPRSANLHYLSLDHLLNLPQVMAQPQEQSVVEDLVQEGAREFLFECKKRDLASLLRATHDAYDRAAYTTMPSLLEMELGGAIDADRRKKLQTALRDMMRNFVRDIVGHIETTAESRANGDARSALEASNPASESDHGGN